MSNVFIVTNFWIFLEEYQASNFIKPKYISFSSDYCKNFSKNDLIDLKEAIKEIIGEFIYLEEIEVFKTNFDKVYMSSGCPLYGEGKYKNILSCNEYIFVEDGGYDYTVYEVDNLVEQRKKSSIFVFDINKFSMKNFYKNVVKLDISKSIELIKQNIFDSSLGLNIQTPILFTGPKEVQNNRYIEHILNSYEQIIIKQHPRDSRDFSKFKNVVISKKVIPGQYLEVVFKGEKLYEYKNATIFMEKDELEKIKL